MISRLLNNSFKAAAFPKAWKVAEVISVPKEGNVLRGTSQQQVDFIVTHPIESKRETGTQAVCGIFDNG